MNYNNKKQGKIDIYVALLGILAVCFVISLFTSGLLSLSSFKGSITGAVVIGDATQETALNALLQAEKDMQEMRSAGFGVVWVNDTLIEAKKYFEGEDYTDLLKDLMRIRDPEKREKAKALIIEAQEKIGYPVDYEKVLEKTKEISKRKAQAYDITDSIGVYGSRIKKFEDTMDMTEALEILDKARTEFEEERYDGAVKLLSQIDQKIEDIRSENTIVRALYRASKETTLNFIKEHYIGISITLIIFIAVFLLSYNRIRVKTLNKKIKDMEIEKQVLTELMKKAQTERYKKATMPKKTYDTKMARYKERIQQIKQQLPVVQARLDKLAKMKRIV